MKTYKFHAAFLHCDVIKHKHFYAILTVFSTSGKDSTDFGNIFAKVPLLGGTSYYLQGRVGRLDWEMGQSFKIVSWGGPM
jgi:hypothetical protein